MTTPGALVSRCLITIIKVIGSVMGLVGNGAVLYIVKRNARLRTRNNILHVSLAVYDMAACVVTMFVNVSKLVMLFCPVSEQVQLVKEGLCTAVKSCALVTNANLLTLANIALVRSWNILYPGYQVPLRYFIVTSSLTLVISVSGGIYPVVQKPAGRFGQLVCSANGLSNNDAHRHIHDKANVTGIEHRNISLWPIQDITGTPNALHGMSDCFNVTSATIWAHENGSLLFTTVSTLTNTSDIDALANNDDNVTDSVDVSHHSSPVYLMILVYLFSTTVLVVSYTRMFVKIRMLSRVIGVYNTGYYVTPVITFSNANRESSSEEAFVSTNMSRVNSPQNHGAVNVQDMFRARDFSDADNVPRGNHVTHHVMKEKTVMISSALVLGVFVLSYIPLAIAYMIIAVFQMRYDVFALEWVFAFFLLNHVANPYVYSIMCPVFNRDFRQLLCSRKNRRTPVIPMNPAAVYMTTECNHI